MANSYRLITDCYQSIYRHILVERTLPGRFMIYQAQDETGWGNKLRGIYSAFLLALLTNRVLLTDYTLLLETFHPPKGIEWDMARFKLWLRSPQTLFELDPCHRREEIQLLATADLNQAFPQNILIHSQGNAFDTAILDNPLYQSQLTELFGSDFSQREVMGQIMTFLLQSPTQHFLHMVQQTQQDIGWVPSSGAISAIGVQFRTFYDVGSPHLQYTHRFTQNLDAALQQELNLFPTAPGNLRLFITTDNLTVTREVAAALKHSGEVVYSHKFVVHTGVDCSTLRLKIRCWLERFLSKGVSWIWKQWNWNLPPELTRIKVDWYRALPRTWRHRPQYAALVDWYLLGECQVLISTMTSYAVFAAARTGNQAVVIRIDLAGNCYQLIERYEELEF